MESSRDKNGAGTPSTTASKSKLISAVNTSSGGGIKRKRANRSEIDRLLSDEGTLNMLNSINTLVPADQKSGGRIETKNSQTTGAVNLVVTPFRNMRGLNYKKKSLTGSSSGTTTKNGNNNNNSEESKIVRRRSSDNSSINSSGSGNGSSTITTRGSGSGSPTFMKRRSSLLSTLIIREEDNGLDNGNGGQKGGFSGVKSSMLGKRISEEKRLQGQQQSRQPNLYDTSQESNTRTILCHKTDDGTVGHVTIAYQASNHTFKLNPKALDELTSTLEELNNDKAIKLIVVSSSGRGIFCAGVDISYLINNDLMRRKLLAEEMGKRIRNLFHTLSKLKKVTIASLNGDVEGLGVTMLPLFDLVYASDKCTFKLIPEYSEGVSVFGSEYIRQNKIINSMIYAGRRLTAQEAMSAGLVTEILWPAKYHEELFMRIKNILKIHRSAQTMESLKKILTKGKNFISEGNGPSSSSLTNSTTSLHSGLDIESKILVENWVSNKFQEKYKKGVISQIIKS